jgi:hypothetical protein
MIISTGLMILIQAIIVGGIIYTNDPPCPAKYMKGGDIVRYCKLDYGAKWVLKEEHQLKK